MGARAGHTDTAVALIEAGADVNARNNDELTALALAARAGNEELVIIIQEVVSVQNAEREQAVILTVRKLKWPDALTPHALDDSLFFVPHGVGIDRRSR